MLMRQLCVFDVKGHFDFKYLTVHIEIFSHFGLIFPQQILDISVWNFIFLLFEYLSENVPKEFKIGLVLKEL